MLPNELDTQLQPFSASRTTGIAILVAILSILIGIVVISFGTGFEIAMMNLPEQEIETMSTQISEQLMLDGDFNAINYLISMGFIASMLVILIANNKTLAVREYLALNTLPSLKQTLMFTGIFILYSLLFSAIANVLEIPAPESMVQLYKTTDYVWLSLFVVVIAAPLIEEVIFRGFLYQGWQHSKLGVTGTIILTSILFTAIHADQYQLSVLLLLSIFAIILGVARYYSKSLYLPIFLHFINNTYASIDLYFLMNP